MNVSLFSGLMELFIRGIFAILFNIEMFEGNFSKKLKNYIYARIVINFKLLVLLTDYERFVEKFRLSIEIARYFQISYRNSILFVRFY